MAPRRHRHAARPRAARPGLDVLEVRRARVANDRERGGLRDPAVPTVRTHPAEATPAMTPLDPERSHATEAQPAMSDVVCQLCKTTPAAPGKRFCASCSEKKRELASRNARAGGIAPGDAERGRELAARSASRRRVLTVEDADGLPHLDSTEHVRQAVEQVQRWAIGGLIPGAVANAIVRAAEIALRALDSELDTKRIKQLEQRIAELEAERDGGGWRLPR